MLIECPSCGTRANLPDSKAGAKVRCSECERIYLARAVGTRAATTSRSSALPVTIGAVVVVLIIALIAINSRGPSPRPQPPPVTEEVARVQAPVTGWDSPAVKFARDLHVKAAAGAESELQMMLAEDRVWARIRSEEEEREVEPAGYLNVEGPTRIAFLDGVLKGLVAKDPENMAGAWGPFDGTLLDEGDKEAHVRLTLRPQDAAQAGTRHIDWLLVRTPTGWRAWSWERWFSPEELAAGRIARSASRAKKTLSDGSVVFEAEPERVEYMDSTTPQERAHIEAMIAQMIDFSTRPAPRTEAQNELRAIGKPAIPGLLNKFYELDQAGWDDLDAVSAGQAVHMLLMDITGYVTSFNPHEALGGTDERRDSGVRQWFFWYSRHFARFEARPEEVDLLDEALQPTNEAERREYERNKRLQESGEKP